MEMMKILASTYYDRGDFMLARNIYRQISQIQQEQKDYASLVTTEINLAKCCYRCGFIDEALDGFQQVLDAISGQFKDDHRMVLELKNEIANCLLSQGEYSQALDHFQKIAKVDADKGVENEDTLVTEVNVALCLSKLNKLNEAYSIYQTVLKKQLELHKNPSHSHVVTTKNNIASVLFRMGKTEDSMKYLEGAKKDLSGEKKDALTVMETKQNLIASLQAVGKYQEAFELCLEVQKIIKTKFHDKHPMAMSNQLNMVMILSSLNMYDEAMQIALDSKKLHEATYDSKSPKILDILMVVAICYTNLNKFEDALKIQKDAEERFRNTVDTRGLANLRNNMAQTLFKLKRFDEGLAMINSAESELEKILGTAHPEVIIAKENKGMILQEAGKYSESATILRIAEKLNRANGNLEACTKDRKALLKCYVNFPDLNQALEIYSHLVGQEYNDHELTLEKNKLANKLADANLHTQALRVFKEVEQIMQSIGLPPHNQSLLNTKLNIGNMLQALGKTDEANSCFKYVESVEKQKRKT